MHLPIANSGRIVVGMWWIAVIVLVTSYCGNLVAFLTFPQVKNGIDYCFQALKNDSVNYFVLRSGTFFEQHITVNTLKVLKNCVKL